MKTRSLAPMQLRKLERKAAVRRDFLNGIVSYQELADRHQISYQTIYGYIQEIRQEIRQEYKRAGETEIGVIEQRLVSTYACAVDSYEKSKLDAETITTSTSVRTCMVCRGTGIRKDDPCDVCNGDGSVSYTETRKTIRGQSGDPNHLRVQVDVLKEINRIRGHHQHDKQTVNVFAQAENVIVGIDLSKADDDSMLDALEAFDRLTQAVPRQETPALPVESIEGRSENTNGPDDLDAEDW
jgi:hypothetical protein